MPFLNEPRTLGEVFFGAYLNIAHGCPLPSDVQWGSRSEADRRFIERQAAALFSAFKTIETIYQRAIPRQEEKCT
jgi:hypothetical protein